MRRSMNILKPKGPGGWLLLLGGAAVGAFVLSKLLKEHAHSNFANTNNSIYPVHDADLGNSQNSVYPWHIHSHHMFNPHGGHYGHHAGCGCGAHGHHHHHMMHHKHHHHHGKTFPDYTDRANALPTPFFGEHNTPHDSFNIDANLQNLGDHGLYIQTYTGNVTGAP